MTTAHIVRHILEASGLTQEQLAREMGVSFATVNSWVRGRSEPRAKKRELVERLYRYYVSGEQEIPITMLEQKKRDVLTLRAQYPAIATLLARPDVRATMLLALTYNTNRIEGSTLSEADTAAVLFDNITLPNKTLTEHLEAKNQQTAITEILDKAYARALPTLTVPYVLHLHRILMQGILTDAGSFRTHGVRIVGSYVPTANWQSVPERTRTLMQAMRASRVQDPIAQLARTHAEFEQIHPFGDGNGRVGRLLMHLLALRYDLPPVLVLHARKRVYYKCLQKAQLENEYAPLEDFICDALKASYALCTP